MTVMVALLLEFSSTLFLIILACRRFRGGVPGKIGYLAALLGGAGFMDAFMKLTRQFPMLPGFLPASFTRMLLSLCVTFFFLLLFQESGLQHRAFAFAADVCAGLRMLMCITSAEHWTGNVLISVWDEFRTILLFLLGLITISAWFLRRHVRGAVWLTIALTLIFFLPPEWYGTDSAPLQLMLALSLTSAAVTAAHADRSTKT